MTSFFPDLNVWLALSDGGHSHNAIARAWVNDLGPDDLILFSRYTQIGLLRLLTKLGGNGQCERWCCAEVSTDS